MLDLMNLCLYASLLVLFTFGHVKTSRTQQHFISAVGIGLHVYDNSEKW